MTTTRLAFLPLCLLVACSAAGPREGEWTVSAVDITDNECGVGDDLLEDFIDPGSTLNIRDEGRDAFTVGVEGVDPIPCSLDKDAFTCDPIVFAGDLGPVSAEFSSALTGTIDDKENATVNQTVSLDCRGLGCYVAAELLALTFPCAIETTFELAWASDDLGGLAE